MSATDNYRSALQRLITNTPINIQPPYTINKDTVAIEAGRKRGSIKKSRQEFKELINDIQAAAKARATAFDSVVQPTPHRANTARQVHHRELQTIKSELELALQKVVSLVEENHRLKLEVENLTKEKSIVNSFPLKLTSSTKGNGLKD